MARNCHSRNPSVRSIGRSQSRGLASPFADDSSIGQSFVSDRAAPKLRFIENYLLTGGLVSPNTREHVQDPFPEYFWRVWLARSVGSNPSHPGESQGDPKRWRRFFFFLSSQGTTQTCTSAHHANMYFTGHHANMYFPGKVFFCPEGAGKLEGKTANLIENRKIGCNTQCYDVAYPSKRIEGSTQSGRKEDTTTIEGMTCRIPAGTFAKSTSSGIPLRSRAREVHPHGNRQTDVTILAPVCSDRTPSSTTFNRAHCIRDN